MEVRMTTQPISDGMTKNDPATKLARKRLSVLELTKELGSVAEACRRSGMDRTSFYEYKCRFQLQGLEGLKDLLPVAKSHPQTTPDEIVQQIVALALEHPAWGCSRISDHLALAGVAVSFPTVQHILNKQGLGTRYDRLLKLEERAATETITLSDEQFRLFEKANPVSASATQSTRRTAQSGHLLRRQAQRHRRGLSPHRRRYVWELCLWLSAYHQATRSGGGRGAYGLHGR
jgi:hypothetical protein